MKFKTVTNNQQSNYVYPPNCFVSYGYDSNRVFVLNNVDCWLLVTVLNFNKCNYCFDCFGLIQHFEY